MLLVGLFAAVIAAAEYVQPSPGYTSPLLTSTVWPPALCGAMIGALQVRVQ